MRSSGWVVVASVATTIVLVACQQIVGTNKTRQAAVVDAGVNTTTDAAPQPVEPPPPCPAGQKKCDGTCVAIDDPAFGCGETTCAQCSLPAAATTKCKAGACAVATCTSGYADCNDRGDDGCEADLLDAKTCGSCTTACGTAAQFCTPFGCAADCGNLTPCGTTCVDLNNGSAKHCGTCNRNCPADPNKHGDATCVNAQCQITCHSGFDHCDAASPGCEPLQRYYLDGDGDGFGAGDFVLACSAPPNRVAVAGDCLDTDKDVRPNQATYFTKPYTAPGGEPSFDYNCSGAEEGNPGQPISASCSPCSTGYTIPLVGARKGNERCGSTIFNTCPESAQTCAAVGVTSAYACR